MFLFLDESGTDGRKTPYEVLAGVAIPSAKLWQVLQLIHSLEQEHFGVNLHEVGVEFKGNNLLKPKRFKHASQVGPIEKSKRRELTRVMLTKGATAKWKRMEYKPEGHELAAYGQACIAFVSNLFSALPRYGVKAFAAVVERRSAKPTDGFLRKDYRYLLERFGSYAEKVGTPGILVFDEIEQSHSRRLLNSLHAYCSETVSGYRMSDRIIPAPFFVHSDLTPAVQIADLFAYVINWAWRESKKTTAESRLELVGLMKKIAVMEWSGYRNPTLLGMKKWREYGFFYLEGLTDPKSDEANRKGGQDSKKRGQKTESPAPIGRQREHSNAPKSPQLLLPFIEPPSTTEPKLRIKRSGYLDI